MKSKEEEEEEDDEEEEGQKGKRFIEKLRRRAVFVGHRSVFRQPSTPAHISFNPNNPSTSSSSCNFSSRKLAASLWEFYQYYDYDHLIPPLATNMHRAPLASAAPSNRRLRHGHGKATIVDNNGLDHTDHQVSLSLFLLIFLGIRFLPCSGILEI